MINEKIVYVSFNTFEPRKKDKADTPKVGNTQLLEIDIELFNEMSREKFINLTIEAAGQFWSQMTRGRLRNKLLAPKIVLARVNDND